MRTRYFFLLIIASMTIVWSCVSNRLEQPAPSTKTEQETNTCEVLALDTVSFKKHVIPILTENCALASCHNSISLEGNLNLEESVAYAQITRPSRGYLDLKTPTYSVLYNSLTSPANLMPPTGKMPDCKIDIIMKWMGQGAKNN